MRRARAMLLSTVLLLGSLSLLVGGGSVGAAQDAASTDAADHPAVGSWLVDSAPDDPNSSYQLLVLSADGSALDFNAYVDGVTGAGAWAPTGDTTATVTFTVVSNGPAYIVNRASIEVAPDGQSFTGSYTSEFVFDPAQDGTSGEIGPGTVEGTRLAPEAPGTPVASFEDFFPQPDGTPDGTPAS